MATKTEKATARAELATRASAQQAPAVASRKGVANLRKPAKAPAKAAKSNGKGNGKQAPAKAAKPKGKATKQASARQAYAGKILKPTAAGKAAEYRGVRGDCWKLILRNAGKSADTVIGKGYAGRAGDERAFDGSFLAFFVADGSLTLA